MLNIYIWESTCSIFNCNAFLIRALSIYSGKSPVGFVGSWGWRRLWGAACDAGPGMSKAGSCAHICTPWAHHGHARNSGHICFLLICMETIAATFGFQAPWGKLKSFKTSFSLRMKKKPNKTKNPTQTQEKS